MSLEEKTCPHCGRLNEEAIQHAADMERYQDHFEETRKDVYGVAKRFGGITARAVIIAALMLAIFVVFLIDDNVWDIRRWFVTMNSNVHVEEYSSQMERYLEEENYTAFRYFCKNHYIDGYNDNYQDYQPLIQAASAYEVVYSSINSLIMAEDERTAGSYISNIEWGYAWFERSKDEGYYNDENIREKSLSVMEQMETKLKILLRVYLGFTVEETEQFGELNQAERLFLLNKGREEMGYGAGDE